MNTSQARDWVRALLTHYGVYQQDRILKDIIDLTLNVETQLHFGHTKDLESYWHYLAVDGQDEYNLPSNLLVPTMVKVASERYYPAPFPYVDDAKNTSDGRTRVIENGTTVEAIADRWYWIQGTKIQLYPEPAQDTSADTTGTCIVKGSTVSMTSGSFSDTNNKKRRLALVGTSYFVVLSNTTGTFTVDGVPGAQTTYSVYNPGIELWGIRSSTALTIGGTDDIPGTDIDAAAIVYGTALSISNTLPSKKGLNFGLLLQQRDMYKFQAKQAALNKRSAPLTVVPFTLRRDHAGWK